jgi:hypothetical protein
MQKKNRNSYIVLRIRIRSKRISGIQIRKSPVEANGSESDLLPKVIWIVSILGYPYEETQTVQQYATRANTTMYW